MDSDDVGGVGGVGDAEAAAFAESQEAIGLGTLGLTASDLAGEVASGIAAAQGEGQGATAAQGVGAAHEIPPVPRMLEEEKEKISEPGEITEGLRRKKRRRSLLTEEEGGLLSRGPVYKRSILSG